MFDRLAVSAPRMLSVLRIVGALLFLQHGMQKLLHWPHGGHPVAIPGGLLSMGGVAGVIELVGGVLLALGLFSRPVAFIMAGEMAVAYWMVHFPAGFGQPAGWVPAVNQGELAILYCFLFLYILCAGPGPWSLDARRHKA
jgi:putative oxidoreductase